MLRMGVKIAKYNSQILNDKKGQGELKPLSYLLKKRLEWRNAQYLEGRTEIVLCTRLESRIA